MTHKRLLVLVSLILAATLALICVGLALVYVVADSQRGIAQEENVALARRVHERLQLGMTRIEVERQIGGDAKKRYQCWREDVYLIGSSDPRRAAIMYLRYRDEADGTQVLERIGGLDQDMLFSYESCEVSYP